MHRDQYSGSQNDFNAAPILEAMVAGLFLPAAAFVVFIKLISLFVDPRQVGEPQDSQLETDQSVLVQGE